jgi:hypothetical protein
MVKPAMPYLDVIASLRQATTLPIAAYHVSGEYAMLKAACQVHPSQNYGNHCGNLVIQNSEGSAHLNERTPQ